MTWQFVADETMPSYYRSEAMGLAVTACMADSSYLM
jgi:hypothetical protein